MKRAFLILALLCWAATAEAANNPSYLNTGGQGNRSAAITVTASTGLFAAGYNNANKLVDGTNTNTLNFNGAAASGATITFDFGSGASKIITEACLSQNSYNIAQGVWQWQGSNNGSSWTSIGSSFSLGSAGANSYIPGTSNTYSINFSLGVNTAGYRYYRMLGVSGNTNGSPHVYQMEFKIDDWASPGPTTLATVQADVTAATLTYTGANSDVLTITGPTYGAYTLPYSVHVPAATNVLSTATTRNNTAGSATSGYTYGSSSANKVMTTAEGAGNIPPNKVFTPYGTYIPNYPTAWRKRRGQ